MRAELQHIRRLAEGVDITLLGNLHRCRRVGVLHQNVGALIDQRLGGIGLLAGIDQVLIQMILTLKSGLIVCAPSMKALMPITTSGIGKETI